MRMPSVQGLVEAAPFTRRLGAPTRLPASRCAASLGGTKPPRGGRVSRPNQRTYYERPQTARGLASLPAPTNASLIHAGGRASAYEGGGFVWLVTKRSQGSTRGWGAVVAGASPSERRAAIGLTRMRVCPGPAKRHCSDRRSQWGMQPKWGLSPGACLLGGSDCAWHPA